MLTETIDTLDVRYVAVIDKPGSYLSSDMDDKVHVVVRGTLSELMVVADPSLYQPFVSYEMGQAVLYVRL